MNDGFNMPPMIQLISLQFLEKSWSDSCRLEKETKVCQTLLKSANICQSLTHLAYSFFMVYVINLKIIFKNQEKIKNRVAHPADCDCPAQVSSILPKSIEVCQILQMSVSKTGNIAKYQSTIDKVSTLSNTIDGLVKCQ